eukprot:GFUD01006251.1.p1 GENE.GFUD01006251.1~~GFUD01006251.1.p1  ORF type:complete len:1390 (+),score=406.14 GFUD01006251.1:54-4223(+)
MAKEKQNLPGGEDEARKKKKSKSRTSGKDGGSGRSTSKKRATFCPNSSKSFNMSRSYRQPYVSTSALKKNNDELAKSLNKFKLAIATIQKDKMALERENFDLRAENSSLRSNVDPALIEAEVQKRLVDYLGPVKMHINSAIDNMVGLSDNLTQSMKLVSAPMRMSTQSQSLAGPSRSSSVGTNFRMRPVTSFQTRDGGNNSAWGREGGGSGNSPPKQLSKVSPMVAGHAISRPRIQLTRMDITAMSAAREQLNLANGDEEEVVASSETVESEGEPIELVEEPVELVEEEAEEEHLDEGYMDLEASPPHPGRNRFNLTNIGEENSMLEDSRLEESILEESRTEETEEPLEPMEILQEEDSQEENETRSPEEPSLRRQSRSALRESVGHSSRQSVGQPSRQSVGHSSRQSVGQAGSSLARLSVRQSLSAVTGASPGQGSVRQSLGQGFRQEGGDSSPSPQVRLSRPPLRDLSMASPSPQVDILKTQRHPAVVLSDLVTMNHPALPPQYNQPSPHSTPLLPSPSPLNRRTSAPVIPVEVFPEDPSESFLEQMCDNDPLEGPSWLFASVHKKKRRSSVARKLSAVWSDNERASTMGSSSGRGTSSLDSSDLDYSSAGEGASSREVSGYVLDRDLIENPVVVPTPDATPNNSVVEGVPATPVSSTGSIAVDNMTRFEEDMEMTRTMETRFDKELNNSNQENNPVELVSSGSIDESNLSISVSQTPRTPLSSLTYTDPSGAVVKFNPRTDTGVTVAGLREAHILLNNVGMTDSTGRATTPYKLSECYIDLSPGRSMSLDQLFSLGLRAGISSPSGNMQKVSKRKYASEAQVGQATPPSKKKRMTDLPSLRQRGVRASLDLIPPNLNQDVIVNRATMEYSPSGNNFVTRLPSPSVNVPRYSQEIVSKTVSDGREPRARDTEKPIETCEQPNVEPVEDNTVTTNNFDKSKKKSVMPSFIYLEKSPTKTASASSEKSDEVQESVEVASKPPGTASVVESVESVDENQVSAKEIISTEPSLEPERSKRKTRVNYALLNGEDDDDKALKKDKSEKQSNLAPGKKGPKEKPTTVNLTEVVPVPETSVRGPISDMPETGEKCDEDLTGEKCDEDLTVEGEVPKDFKKTKTSNRLSKRPSKMSKDAKKSQELDANQDKPEHLSLPTVVSNEILETNSVKDQGIRTESSKKAVEAGPVSEVSQRELDEDHLEEVEKTKPRNRLSKHPKKVSKDANNPLDNDTNQDQSENLSLPTVVLKEVLENDSVEDQGKGTSLSQKADTKSRKNSRKASKAQDLVNPTNPTNNRESLNQVDRKSGAVADPQVEDEASQPSIGRSSLSRDSSIGASADAAEGRGRSRRGSSQVSYKEPALGKKMRQGDAGSSVYSDFKPGIKSTKVKKSVKKK